MMFLVNVRSKMIGKTQSYPVQLHTEQVFKQVYKIINDSTLGLYDHSKLLPSGSFRSRRFTRNGQFTLCIDWKMHLLYWFYPSPCVCLLTHHICIYTLVFLMCVNDLSMCASVCTLSCLELPLKGHFELYIQSIINSSHGIKAYFTYETV